MLVTVTARIEQTRHAYDPGLERPRGLLRAMPPAGTFRHARRQPPTDLAAWVENFWSVRWDLTGHAPFGAETLPHPSVHLTLDGGTAWLGGVHTGTFTRCLSGRGLVIGVKFAPGAFRPFLGHSVSLLRNRVVPANTVFGPDADQLAARFAAWSPTSDDEPEEVAALTDLLRHHLPAVDPATAVARSCVELIQQTPPMRTVEALARASGHRRRSLQRLFTEYVGVPVKWVVRRARLHDVVDAIHSGHSPDWARLAVDLGYCDQAHLIRDFRSVVGDSPAAAFRRAGSRPATD
jgi:AraC-like DNA-binding protein